MKKAKGDFKQEIRMLSSGTLCKLCGSTSYAELEIFQESLIQYIENNFNREGGMWDSWIDVVNCYQRRKLRKELFEVEDGLLAEIPESYTPEEFRNGFPVDAYREHVLAHLDKEYNREEGIGNWRTWCDVVVDYEKTLKKNKTNKAA